MIHDKNHIKYMYAFKIIYIPQEMNHKAIPNKERGGDETKTTKVPVFPYLADCSGPLETPGVQHDNDGITASIY